MALDQSALLKLLDALKIADAGDVVRCAAQAVFQALIEAKATVVIGASPHERSPERVTRHRDRPLTAAAGDVELRIPSCAPGRSSRPCWSGGG